MLEGFTPWPAELAARYRQRGYWRDQPLGDIVDRGAELFGERVALHLLRWITMRSPGRMPSRSSSRFCRPNRSRNFKLPERLEVVENFPLTNVGKVSKKDLREDIARKLGADRAAAASATIVQPQV